MGESFFVFFRGRYTNAHTERYTSENRNIPYLLEASHEFEKFGESVQNIYAPNDEAATILENRKSGVGMLAISVTYAVNRRKMFKGNTMFGLGRRILKIKIFPMTQN